MTSPLLSEPARSALTVRQITLRMRQRRVLPVVAGMSVFAVVVAWTFLSTPRYQSAALLRIETRTASSPLLDEFKSVPGIGLMGLGRDELETEIGVLKSRRVADAVLDSLGLTVRVVSPASSRDSVLRVRTLQSSDVEGTLTLTRETDGRYRIATTKFVGDHPPPAQIAPGDSMRVGGLQLQLASALRNARPASIELRFLPRYAALKRFDDRLDIRMQEGGSRLVKVAFEDPDRTLAAAVVSRIVTEYIGYTIGNDRSDDDVRVGELRREAESYAKRLSASEERLRQFKERRRLVIPDEQATAQLKRIGVLRTTLDALEIEQSALARMLSLVNARSANGRSPVAYRQLATFPSLIANRAIQDYLMTLVDLENKRSELGLRRTEDNEEMKQITGRISELERQLQRTGTQYLESLDQQVAVATQSVKDLTVDLDAFPQQEMDYVRLLRERTLLNEGFLILQKQLKQTQLQIAMRTDKVRVVDPPRVANAKDRAFPRVGAQLLLGAVLGIAVALVLAFGRELVGGDSSHASVSATQNAGSESAP